MKIKNMYLKMLVNLLIALSIWYAYMYISNYIGYYGSWRKRTFSTDIADSKRRGVFAKELNYKIDSSFGDIGNFRPFIEKGFYYGYHSINETRPLIGSEYPYQLYFQNNQYPDIQFFISDSDLIKFDSANLCWGYLRTPHLKDTVTLDIIWEKLNKRSTIKVWDDK